MIGKNLAEITLSDIEALCQNAISEGQRLDFKLKLSAQTIKEKRDFLADVSAFANASGGDIVFGIREQDGAAREAAGFEVANIDKAELDLRNLLRDCLQPRLAAVEMRWLAKSGNIRFLVLRVPRSWHAPHRVTLDGHERFYIRHSNGNHPMDVDELRRAFLLADSVGQRIAQFRRERLNAVTDGLYPVPMSKGAKCILHFVPLASIVDPPSLDFEFSAKANIAPPYSRSYTYSYCLEGIANFTPTDSHGVSAAYSLMFRTGEAEMVRKVPVDSRIEPQQISQSEIAYVVETGWQGYRQFMETHDIVPPVYVFLTLWDVEGFTAPLDNLISGSATMHRSIEFPPVVVQQEALRARPSFLFGRTLDILANAFGYPKYHWPQ